MLIVCCIVFGSNRSGSYGNVNSLLHNLSIKRIRELWENPEAMGMLIVCSIVFGSNRSGSYGNIYCLLRSFSIKRILES